MKNLHEYLKISPAVQKALDEGRPVLALESTIISHGMPYPQNLETARLVRGGSVREARALSPATIAIHRRQAEASGLNDEELEYACAKAGRQGRPRPAAAIWPILACDAVRTAPPPLPPP